MNEAAPENELNARDQLIEAASQIMRDGDRKLGDQEIESLHYSAAHYVKLKDRYLGMAAG